MVSTIKLVALLHLYTRPFLIDFMQWSNDAKKINPNYGPRPKLAIAIYEITLICWIYFENWGLSIGKHLNMDDIIKCLEVSGLFISLNFYWITRYLSKISLFMVINVN